MFDQQIQYPVHVRLQCPPTVSAKSLRTQTNAIEVGSDRRFTRHLTINEPRERAEIIQLARIMFTRYGFTPTGLNRILSGPVDSPLLLEKFDKPNVGVIASVNKMVMGDAYKSSGYLHQFVAGEVSKEEYLVKITNWDLRRRMALIAPTTGETEAETAVRLTEADRYETAITTLRGQVKTCYKQAWLAACEDVQKQKGATKLRAETARDFYAARIDNVITPLFADFDLLTVGELRSFLIMPLFFRRQEERILFWEDRLKADQYASFFGHCATVVDLPNAQQIPRFATMWGYRLPAICDVLHRYVVARNDIRSAMQLRISDPTFRAFAHVSDKRAYVKSFIRSLNDPFESEEYGDWRWVPVLEDRGRKKAGEAKDTVSLPTNVVARQSIW